MAAEYKRCDCHFCGYSLRFEISRAGQLVNCLQCGMETVLFIPDAEPPYSLEQFLLETRNVGWARSTLGVRNLVGVVENKSKKNLDWVRIEFILHNHLALPVGSTSDCLIRFPAGGQWRFQAPVFQTEALVVSAPMLSCEYGKLFRPKQAVAEPRPGPLTVRI